MSTDPIDVPPALPVVEFAPEEELRGQFFQTEHLHADLKGRSVRGGMVTIGAQGIKFCLNMISTMALARLLAPAEFGVVAMVSPITGFMGLFKDLGLSMATVQKEQINHDQVSTLFWINVTVSVILSLITAALSPLVGWFYGDIQACWVTLALAGTFIFGGLTAQHGALLSRNMRFGLLATIDISTMVVSIFTGIFTAWLGWSYWSLVAMAIAGGLVNCIAVWIASPWRPGKPVRHAGTRAMLKFGGGMTAANLVAFLCTQIDRVALGRLYRPAGMALMTQQQLVLARTEALGVYSRAFTLSIMPLVQVMAPLNSVMMPLFARLAKDRERLSSAAGRVMELAAAAALPMALVIFLNAADVVHLVLGSNPQWVAAIPVTQAFAIITITFPVSMVVGTLFSATGRSDVLLKWEIFWLCVLIPTILISVRWGAMGVAIGMASAWMAVTPIQLYLGHRILGIKLRIIMQVIGRNCLTAFLCIASVLCVRLCTGPLRALPSLILSGVIIATLHLTALGYFGVLGRIRELLRNKSVSVQN